MDKWRVVVTEDIKLQVVLVDPSGTRENLGLHKMAGRTLHMHKIHSYCGALFLHQNVAFFEARYV
jgi:hypothetical protein